MRIAKEDKLRAYWGYDEDGCGPDVVLCWPLGKLTKADGAWLSGIFNREFIEELERRGYDKTTLRFEVSPKFPTTRPDKFGTLNKKYTDGDTDLPSREYEPNEQSEKRKCGQCAHYMPYCGSDEHSGDCGSVTFNKECYEGQNPFQDTDIPLVQVEEDETACGLFSKRRTAHVKKWKKAHPEWYKQD